MSLGSVIDQFMDVKFSNFNLWKISHFNFEIRFFLFIIIIHFFAFQSFYKSWNRLFRRSEYIGITFTLSFVPSFIAPAPSFISSCHHSSPRAVIHLGRRSFLFRNRSAKSFRNDSAIGERKAEKIRRNRNETNRDRWRCRRCRVYCGDLSPLGAPRGD